MKNAKELVLCGKALCALGFAIGQGGNISKRDGALLMIKKKGVDMALAGEEGYLRISFDQAKKGHPSLSSESPLHIACYASGKDIGAVMHVHSPYMVAAAEKTKSLKSNSYEFDCILGGEVPVVGFIAPGSQKLAAAVADKVKKGGYAVLMRRHGAIAVGRDINEAFLRILALERACITFLALSR
jgi:ribulose-5-phosphate 4-epimerase/fuculose-1-phosphate aldolase